MQRKNWQQSYSTLKLSTKKKSIVHLNRAGKHANNNLRIREVRSESYIVRLAVAFDNIDLLADSLFLRLVCGLILRYTVRIFQMMSVATEALRSLYKKNGIQQK